MLSVSLLWTPTTYQPPAGTEAELKPFLREVRSAFSDESYEPFDIQAIDQMTTGVEYVKDSQESFIVVAVSAQTNELTPESQEARAEHEALVAKYEAAVAKAKKGPPSMDDPGPPPEPEFEHRGVLEILAIPTHELVAEEESTGEEAKHKAKSRRRGKKGDGNEEKEGQEKKVKTEPNECHVASC